MADRALHACIAVSLVLHGLALAAGSQARIELAPTDPPVQPVRIRLQGPATRTIFVDAGEPPSAPSRPVDAASSAARLAGRVPPPVSAPPPKSDPTPDVDPAPSREPAPTETKPSSHAKESDPPGEAEEPTALSARSATRPAGDGATPNGTSAASDPSVVDVPATGSTDEDEDRLARYVAAIRARVERRKRYPPLARKRSVEGRVIARLVLRADGGLDGVELEGATSPLLRRATNDAIRSAAPYPAPPDGALTIELPIDYSLRDAS